MVPSSDHADEHSIELLEQVEFHSLSATPGTIAPFAASLIKWNVSAPGGVSVLLESTKVHTVGEQIVTPLSTRTFHLRARAGTITQNLAAVTVTVDQAACRIVPVPNLVIEQSVRQGIDELLLELPGTSRRRADVVTVDPSGIGIQLRFKQVVEHFPNPDVDVDAHWQFRASNGALVEHFDELSVSVSFPWWVWLLPIAYPGLPIAIAMAKDSTSGKVRKKAAAGAEALESFVPPGFRILSAGFNPTNFEMLVCPDSSLHELLLPGAPTLQAIKA